MGCPGSFADRSKPCDSRLLFARCRYSDQFIMPRSKSWISTMSIVRGCNSPSADTLFGLMPTAPGFGEHVVSFYSIIVHQASSHSGRFAVVLAGKTIDRLYRGRWLVSGQNQRGPNREPNKAWHIIDLQPAHQFKPTIPNVIARLNSLLSHKRGILRCR